MAPKNPKTRPPFPKPEELARFINESPGKIGKREIARAFQIPAEDKAKLRQVLKDLSEQGLIERRQGRNYAGPGKLPSVLVIRISGLDSDDLLLAEPVGQELPEPAPKIFLRPEKYKGSALGIGDRALVRLIPMGKAYEAQVIRRLQTAAKSIIGVYTEISGAGRIMPTDKREKYDYQVARADRNGAKLGELVSAEILPGRRMGLRAAKVIECLGPVDDPRSISLIAIHTHGIPYDFPEAVLSEAEKSQPVNLGKREDLRDIPFVTIDGADARDFDDAVWAGPDPDPANPNGFVLRVAIADVAHYVRSQSALDRCARQRGNSAYFPDRVVPMLPEALSNDLCSLRPDEDRPVLALEIIIDQDGNKRRHRFMRGLMRSAHRLTYEAVQAAYDRTAEKQDIPLTEQIIDPLYTAYHALEQERRAREPLDLDLPEMQIFIGDDGKISGIQPRSRLDAHKLIEEFMILANVCAAETLEDKKQLCMYRVHEPPELERLYGLKEFLESLDIPFNPSENARPSNFNRILSRTKETANSEVVNQSILRAQSQAIYSPENAGHFGLNLRRYAHFTSPIRRYSDLLVHRALISGLNLGNDGLSDEDKALFNDTAEEISNTERRAMAAERESTDRYIAAYLEDRVGAQFEARISGMIRSGLFVRLSETHADGLVPAASLNGDYYRLDEGRQAMVGDHTGAAYRLGDLVQVQLREVNSLSGGMIFEILDPPPHQTKGNKSKQRRPNRNKFKGKNKKKKHK